MRLGVIDIGSNTVHLLVVDAHPGAQPLPAFSHKTELRLSESLRADGRVSDETADRLVAFIRECLVVAEDQGVGDLGGGSLELATGLDEEPDVALSLPLGAGRLTREHLHDDPPTETASRELRAHVRTTLAQHVRPLLAAGSPDRAVGTSKTMRSLARIAGAAPRAEGPFVPRTLSRDDLRQIVARVGR